jgi:hypothetical protein
VTNSSFGPVKQIDTGVLSIGYAEVGPDSGPPVTCLHGRHYDIHSFVEVAPILCGISGKCGSSRMPFPESGPELPKASLTRPPNSRLSLEKSAPAFVRGHL